MATIRTDSFGNHYLGTFLGGEPYSITDIVALLQSAVGSTRVNYNNSSSDATIAWRPNDGDETYSNNVTTPNNNYLDSSFDFGGSGEGRFGFAPKMSSFSSLAILAARNGSNAYVEQAFVDATGVSNTFVSGSTMWGVATATNFVLYFENGSDYMVVSQGILKGAIAGLNEYPNNTYHFALMSISGQISELLAWRTDTAADVCVVSGSNLNFAHTDNLTSDPTTYEVQMYLRDASTFNPFGYIPNLFKRKVDGGETGTALKGNTRLNFNSSAGDYAGQGNPYAKVVGRLPGNVPTVLDGDYLLMPVYTPI